MISLKYIISSAVYIGLRAESENWQIGDEAPFSFNVKKISYLYIASLPHSLRIWVDIFKFIN